MLRSAEASGFQIARATVAVAEIPVVRVPALLGPADAERQSDSHNAWDLHELAFDEARERSWSCTAHAGEARGFCSTCNAPLRHAIRAEGPVRGDPRAAAPRRTLGYEIVDGIFDPVVGGVVGDVRRTRLLAKELVPHLIHAFRFFDEREPGLPLVSVILPPAIELAISRSRPTDGTDDVRGSFSRATLPVRPGGSESVVARITGAAAAAWIERIAPEAPPPPAEDLEIGVELTSAGDEPEPQLVAWVKRLRVPDPE
jgi:hypothetical protein